MRLATALFALSLVAMPALAEVSVSAETLLQFKKIERATAIVICSIGANDPVAADEALLGSGFIKTEDEGSWNYASDNLTVTMWTVPGFCMVEDSESGTEAMAAAFLGFSKPPSAIGTDVDGCTTYLLDRGVTATLSGPGQDPQCTSDTGSALRFSLPN